MDSKELRQAVGRPAIAKLKQLTNGLKVGRVMGPRILVKTVEPYTEMDRLEKQGLLVVPETAREANTPAPSTGIVVAVGVEAAGLVEGDMVMFSKYAGSECYFNEEQFRILEVREVLCTLETVEEEGLAVAPVA